MTKVDLEKCNLWKEPKFDLVTGIIAAENGELSDEDLVAFVSEYQETLSKLQGSWQNLVYRLQYEGLI
jgi:hypothetical protein